MSSSAVAAASNPSPSSSSGTTTPTARKDAETHHTTLLNTALGIYDTYFAQKAPRELNLDSASKSLLTKHRESGTTTKGRVWNSSELQRMISLYEDIAGGIFRLMATDSVPKFIQTTEFGALRYLLDEDEQDGDLVLVGEEEHLQNRVGEVDEGAFSPGLLQVQGQRTMGTGTGMQTQPQTQTQTPPGGGGGKEMRGGVYATVSQIAKEFSASRLSSSSSSS